jgi:Fic-DOC domain mobile mystery protein B
MVLGCEMMFADPSGATPLSHEEMDGLIPPHISSRDQLNEWEQRGILQAELDFFGHKNRKILTEGFLLKVHKKMFEEVWRWAGKYRLTDKNIGVPHWEVAVKVRTLLQDAAVWVAHKQEDQDEIAARFHHRLVSIHPFPNGNGRHARLMADLLLEQVLNRPRFTWGRGDLNSISDIRTAYISALQSADARDIKPLLVFARS